MPKKWLVIQVAALGREGFDATGSTRLAGMEVASLAPSFPGVTCTVQASLRTGTPPSRHGLIANGYFSRALSRSMFWEQSARLVEGARIWDAYRAGGGTVGMLFWQQSLGESLDLVLSPAPIHRHHGGMIDDCFSHPAGLYPWLCAEVGAPFRLRDYWGPLASIRASRWIADATCALLGDSSACPDLLLVYLPGMDYDGQRFGPSDVRAKRAQRETLDDVERVVAAALQAGYEVVVFGDYAIVPCEHAVPLNAVLREAGLLSCRDVRGRQYLDPHHSRALAMVDHEIAHVYVRHASDTAAVAEQLRSHPLIEQVLDRDAQRDRAIDHPNAGELVVVAADGAWFSYPWWHARSEAPDFAGHVDIHNKPGFDPCELFFGWPPGSVSQAPERIRGSHGKAGAGRETVFASTCLAPPDDVAALGAALGRRLAGG